MQLVGAFIALGAMVLWASYIGEPAPIYPGKVLTAGGVVALIGKIGQTVA